MARKSWLDADAQTTLIDDYARELGSFVEAMADGVVDANEVSNQEGSLLQTARTTVVARSEHEVDTDITDVVKGIMMHTQEV